MLRLKSVLTADDLPYPELCAARLDGELFAVDSCFSPIDLPDTARLRADAIAAQWPDRLIAEQHTAAWIYGATYSPPPKHELCADISARARPSNSRHAHIREVVIDATEVIRLGVIEVTTPVRTVLDLARSSERFEGLERSICSALLVLAGVTADECAEMIETRRNLPNKRLALDRLATVVPTVVPDSAGADAVHVVHGVDAPHGVEHAIEMGRVAHLEDVATEREALARG